MPISFLQERYRAQRIGRIRLGHKETKRRNGKDVTYPVADPFFVLPEELVPFYGPEPTTLRVLFIWDSLEMTFPHYLRRYTRAGLRCLGNGEDIIYRVNEEGVVDVSDYNAMTPDSHVIMEGNSPRRVACLGDQCAAYLSGECKPTGYLRFIVQELPRLGYYDLVCHQKAVIGVKTQLMLCLQMFGRLTDIPFLLHRGEEEQVPVRTPRGMQDMPVRTQWLEIEPEWFQQNLSRRRAVLLESARMQQLQARHDIALLYGPEEGEEVEPDPLLETKDIVGQFAEGQYEDEGQEENEPELEVESKPAVPPEPQDAPQPEPGSNGQRPYMPIVVRARLQEKAAKLRNGSEADDGKRGLIVAKIAEALQDKDARIRHLISLFLTSKESSREWDQGEVDALYGWLMPKGKDQQTGDWPLGADAMQEVRAIARLVQLEVGQQELPLLEKAPA